MLLLFGGRVAPLVPTADAAVAGGEAGRGGVGGGVMWSYEYATNRWAALPAVMPPARYGDVARAAALPLVEGHSFVWLGATSNGSLGLIWGGDGSSGYAPNKAVYQVRIEPACVQNRSCVYPSRATTDGEASRAPRGALPAGATCGERHGAGRCLRGMCECVPDFVERAIADAPGLARVVRVTPTVVSSKHAPSQRAYHATASDGEQLMWIYGGAFESNLRHETLAELWEYQLHSNRWVHLDARAAGGPGPLSGAALVPRLNEGRRVYALYLFGGYDGFSTRDTLWCFDLRTEVWSAAAPAGGAAPVAREGMAYWPLVDVDDDNKTFAMIFGGGSSRASSRYVDADALWELDTRRTQPAWRELRTADAPANMSAACAAIDDRGFVWVFGGMNTRAFGYDPADANASYAERYARYLRYDRYARHGQAAPEYHDGYARSAGDAPSADLTRGVYGTLHTLPLLCPPPVDLRGVAGVPKSGETALARCEEGWHLMGGGCEWGDQAGRTHRASLPAGRDSWRCDGPAGHWKTAHAICARSSGDVELARIVGPAMGSDWTRVTCPTAAPTALGGGCSSEQGFTHALADEQGGGSYTCGGNGARGRPAIARTLADAYPIRAARVPRRRRQDGHRDVFGPARPRARAQGRHVRSTMRRVRRRRCARRRRMPRGRRRARAHRELPQGQQAGMVLPQREAGARDSSVHWRRRLDGEYGAGTTALQAGYSVMDSSTQRPDEVS